MLISISFRKTYYWSHFIHFACRQWNNYLFRMCFLFYCVMQTKKTKWQTIFSRFIIYQNEIVSWLTTVGNTTGNIHKNAFYRNNCNFTATNEPSIDMNMLELILSLFSCMFFVCIFCNSRHKYILMVASKQQNKYENVYKREEEWKVRIVWNYFNVYLQCMCTSFLLVGGGAVGICQNRRIFRHFDCEFELILPLNCEQNHVFDFQSQFQLIQCALRFFLWISTEMSLRVLCSALSIVREFFCSVIS